MGILRDQPVPGEWSASLRQLMAGNQMDVCYIYWIFVGVVISCMAEMRIIWDRRRRWRRREEMMMGTTP